MNNDGGLAPLHTKQAENTTTYGIKVRLRNEIPETSTHYGLVLGLVNVNKGTNYGLVLGGKTGNGGTIDLLPRLKTWDSCGFGVMCL